MIVFEARQAAPRYATTTARTGVVQHQRPKNRFIRKGEGQHRALNGLQQRSKAARRAFKVKAMPRGRGGRKSSAMAFEEVFMIGHAESVLESCKSGVLSTDGENLTRRTTPPRPSPARGASRPLSSGVQAAGRFASLTAPQTRGLGRSSGIKGSASPTSSPVRCSPCRLRSACGFRACP